MYDLLIIGGGAAGMTAGLYAARAGLRTLIIEKGFAGGQASTTNWIDNYPGFPDGIGGPELMMKFQEQAEKAGCEFAWEDISGVELTGKIKRANGYEGRAAIIATGAERRKLGVPGEDMNVGRGVSYCATCDGAFYKDKTVAVIGGGNTAVEDALYLARFAKKVYLIHRRDELRARGGAVERARRAAEFMLNRRAARFDRAEDGIDIIFDDGGKLNVDGTFIAVGTRPITDAFKGQVELDAAGYIAAGEDCRTSLPGVFCAGDCRAKPLRQVVTAASDGAAAANAASIWLDEQ
jgi:thioredoxin reductase (NADPH)